MYTDTILHRLSQKGVFTTQEAEQAGMSRMTLTRLVQSGKIQRIARGKYVAYETQSDQLYLEQQIYPPLIYSHETALYLSCYLSAPPSVHIATLPKSNRNVHALSQPLRLYYVSPYLHILGAIMVQTPQGHAVTVYNMERTICDLMRHRYHIISPQLIYDLLKNYMQRPDSNMTLLHDYANQFQISSLLNKYIDLLL